MIGTATDRPRAALDPKATSRGRPLSLVAAAALLLAAGPAGAQTARERHDQAVAALTKLGAKVATHKEKDGTVFTFVSCYESSFGPKWTGGEADLKHLKDLTNLKVLNVRWAQLTDKG